MNYSISPNYASLCINSTSINGNKISELIAGVQEEILRIYRWIIISPKVV
jgi:hypothetical protein